MLAGSFTLQASMGPHCVRGEGTSSPIYTSPSPFPHSLPRSMGSPMLQGPWVAVALTSPCWLIHKMRVLVKVSVLSS